MNFSFQGGSYMPITSLETLLEWLQNNNPEGEFLPFHNLNGTKTIIVLDADVTKIKIPDSFHLVRQTETITELFNIPSIQENNFICVKLFEYRNVKRNLKTGKEI